MPIAILEHPADRARIGDKSTEFLANFARAYEAQRIGLMTTFCMAERAVANQLANLKRYRPCEWKWVLATLQEDIWRVQDFVGLAIAALLRHEDEPHDDHLTEAAYCARAAHAVNPAFAVIMRINAIGSLRRANLDRMTDLADPQDKPELRLFRDKEYLASIYDACARFSRLIDTAQKTP